MQESRTEAPSPERRERARREGRVARSPLLSFAAAWLAFGAVAGYGAADALLRLRQAVVRGLGGVGDASAVEALRASAWTGAELLAPPLLAMFVAALVVGVAQVGPMFSAGALAPRPGRFGERLRELVSPERIGEATWSALAAFVLVGIAAGVCLAAWPGLIDLGRRTPAGAARAFAPAVRALVLWTGGMLAVLGLADLVLRRLRLVRALRTTRRDRMREWRESEGDPRVRAARRRVHEELARGPRP
jgi:flagellar biosynthesis protein FlhB